MKGIVPGLLAFSLLSIQDGCKKAAEKAAPAPACYKGRLALKGICMNYTIEVLSGSIDTARIESSWHNDANDSVYHNVFGLGSPCTFPPGINAGDEFYFTLDSNAVQNCAVCMAYYPTPRKKLAIRVQGSPCGQP